MPKRARAWYSAMTSRWTSRLAGPPKSANRPASLSCTQAGHPVTTSRLYPTTPTNTPQAMQATATGRRNSGSAVSGHLFADNAPESLFPLLGLPLDVLAQRRIDQRLVADFTARPIGDRTEIADQIFIQADGDPHLPGL